MLVLIRPISNYGDSRHNEGLRNWQFSHLYGIVYSVLNNFHIRGLQLLFVVVCRPVYPEFHICAQHFKQFSIDFGNGCTLFILPFGVRFQPLSYIPNVRILLEVSGVIKSVRQNQNNHNFVVVWIWMLLIIFKISTKLTSSFNGWHV
jgi:hypothetical protein